MLKEKKNGAQVVKTRNFSIVTYLSAEQLKTVLNARSNQVKYYAFIEHDKDVNPDGSLKERHIHCLIKTYCQVTLSGICGWFKGFTDSENKVINTFTQQMFDIESSFDYLTHNTEAARLEGKFLYPDSEVVSNNVEFFRNSVDDGDNLTSALDDLLNGEPLDVVRRRYGRDFIIHYGHIRTLFNDIQNLTGGKVLA